MANRITHRREKQVEQQVEQPEANETMNPTPETKEAPLEAYEITENEDEKELEISYEFDEENMIVEFDLADGTHIVMKEPKPKTFYLMESWIRQPENPYQDSYFMMLKIALLSVTRFGKAKAAPELESFMETLNNFEDVDRLIGGLQFFRSAMQSYERRLSGLAKRANLQLPG